MKFIFAIIKGAFIGVANIIPGVSGGTMAVSMGVYDKLIEAINKLTKEFKKSFMTLLPLIIGMAAGIGIFSYIIPYSLTHFAFQTCMCFSGLVIGGIPQIIEETKNALKKEKKKINPVHIIAFLVMLGVAVGMALANGSETSSAALAVDAKTLIILVFIGIIAAATMIIPGVSGSLIMMILGYYTGVVSLIRDFISALKNLNWDSLLHCIILILPFAIGCIAGVLLVSKLISWLFKKFESITYCAILGLIFASPFAIFYNMESSTFNAVTIIVGIVLFTASAAFTYFFSKKTK